MRGHVQEQAHVRLAKAVDGLHGIADQEQRAPVVRRPALGELLQQREVTVRGVLELVDQDVADAVIERQREIGGRFVGAERLARRVGDLGVVDPGTLGEHHAQARGGDRQHVEQRIEHLPLALGVGGLRQPGNAGERLAQGACADEIVEQRVRPCAHLL